MWKLKSYPRLNPLHSFSSKNLTGQAVIGYWLSEVKNASGMGKGHRVQRVAGLRVPSCRLQVKKVQRAQKVEGFRVQRAANQ